MRRLLLMCGILTVISVIVGAQKVSPNAEVEDEIDGFYDDSVFNASNVFVDMPAQTLDLLSTSSRLDLLDYYAADSIADVVNSMEGLSHLIPPVTDNYLKVQVTPVTSLTIKILPYGKGNIAATVYTIGDSLQAADTEIRFYDEKMVELDRSKFIKLLTTPDFFNFKGVDSETRKALLDLVPFPTVEYILEPEGNRLQAHLTSGEFLGKETLEKIGPYLVRDRYFNWDGKKFKLLK